MSVSGLNRRQRASAHRIIATGVRLMLAHPASVHYTQGSARWEGIDHHLRIVRGQFPKHGDCSSTATWLLWNALTHASHRGLKFPDIVNGEHWHAGYTGTMLGHGKRVHMADGLRIGDCVFYPGHVAVSLGHRIVFSHGGEAGPFKLDIDYRHDRQEIRRYI